MTEEEGKIKIVIAGAGGGGSNTINRLAAMGGFGAKLVAFNTDKKHLKTISNRAERILLGTSLTKGLGAGGDAGMGEKAAWQSRKLIEREVHDADLLFICAGMGGGTGSGCSPLIAQIAQDHGALVVGIVTFPFSKLEKGRVKVAQKSTAKLSDSCNSLVVVQNDLLYKWVPNLKIDQAFALADEVTSKAVSGISRTILEPSLVNLDFADFKSITQDGGLGMISMGEASGYSRVEDVVASTLKNPLLDVDYSQASGALLHFTGGPDLTLGDVTTAGDMLTEKLPEDVNVIWGARTDSTVEKKLEAFALFTGIPSPLLLDPDAGKKKED